MEAHGRSRSADTLADLRAVFETEFWTDSGASSSSEDEGIGSDDSMETGHREGSESGDTVTAGGDAGRNHDSGNSGGDKTFRSQIKRSKSLVAIAQFRSRLLQHISRRFQDDGGGGGGEQAASGESRIDVFGLDLSEICAKTGTEVPDIVTFCIQKIEKLGITDGIYRISGQTARVELMKQTFCAGGLPEHVTEKDVHSVASVLKMYFRSLVEPVFTYSLYPALLATARRPPGEHPRHLQQLLQLLPRHNLLTLRSLCRHLHHLASHHESLILHYHAVFSPDSLAPVTEVSIDQAIARVARTSPSLEPDTSPSLDPATSSLSLVAAAAPAPGRLARRCRSEAANLERLGSSLLRLHIKDEPSSSEAEAEEARGELRPAQQRALCPRHKKMLAAKHPRPRQNKGDTMNKILRALGRVVSFRHGHYTVNDARVRPRRAHETAHISNSSSENMLSNDGDGAPPGHNYFQDVEKVIQQFEFLEDELNVDGVEEVAEVASHGLNVKEEETRSQPEFSQEILAQLEILHNSVKEVNDMFQDTAPSPRHEDPSHQQQQQQQHTGIYFAHLVYVQ